MLKRFAELVALKSASVDTQIESHQAPSIGPDAMSAVEEIVHLWGRKLDETAELQASLRKQLCTDGGLAAVQRWEEVIDRRKLFLETLFNRGIDEALAAKAAVAKHKELVALGESFVGVKARLDAKLAGFGAIAQQVAESAIEAADGAEKTECSKVWAGLKSIL
jgi:hypothetical protein